MNTATQKIIVTFKDGDHGANKKAFEDDIVAKGGKIVQRYELIDGLVAEVPADVSTSLLAPSLKQEHDVELDGTVTTQ
ncbi:hypothetical protein EV174_002813 [Coemansia sp. RSA 2320]|nr:hypothetical protein EV174_002813 [Coemansia sp. RSA 2320]